MKASDNSKTIMILGGDGYLGWSLGLAFANRTNNNIVLVDNLIKRKWEKEVSAKLLVPIRSPKERIAEYQRIYGKSNLSFEKVDLLKQPDVVKVIRKYRPSVIINAAQQPSAPFSMMSPRHAAITFHNNLIGHLNVLWSIAQVDKTITCIKLGSAGCYMDTDTEFLPLEKKDFTFRHMGKKYRVNDAFLPMAATDFYHQSKISDFMLDDLCTKLWNLKVITIQQATIFGATIKENHSKTHASLATRFNYDAVFSTVMNRFVCQVAIKHPLTVYGDGTQKTGLISLSDCVDNFLKIANMEVKSGSHNIIHNYTVRYSIQEIAEKIAKIDSTVKINYIKNPRLEGDGKLSRTVETHRAIRRQSNTEQDFETELARMVEFTKRYRNNIDRSIIMPKVGWVVKENETAKATTFSGARNLARQLQYKLTTRPA